MCPSVALSVPTVRSTLLKSGIVCLEEEELVFWCSLVGADRPPKQAMPVAKQEDLGLCVLRPLSLSLQSVARCKKVTSYV